MGVADALTNSKPGSSDLGNSGFATRSKARTLRGMYGLFAWTATATRGTVRSVNENNKAYLLPGMKLSVNVDVRHVVECLSRQVGDSSFSNQE